MLIHILGSLRKLQWSGSPEERSFPTGSQLLNGSRRGGARLHPFLQHRWIAFTCAPMADSLLTSGDQSEVQAMTQQFPYNLVKSKQVLSPQYTEKYFKDTRTFKHFYTSPKRDVNWMFCSAQRQKSNIFTFHSLAFKLQELCFFESLLPH